MPKKLNIKERRLFNLLEDICLFCLDAACTDSPDEK